MSTRRRDDHEKPDGVTLGKWRNHYTWADKDERRRIAAASAVSRLAKGNLSAKEQERILKSLPTDICAAVQAATPADLIAIARKLSTA